MSPTRWLKAQASGWRTFSPTRSVLVVVHTVTALNRLADILPIFDSDGRVQLVFSFPDASAVTADIEEMLQARGGLVMPWAQVPGTRFDIALSAHHSGDLHEISAPLVTLSHGIGYSKYAAHAPGADVRSQESVYGLSREWLVRDGTVAPSAVVLSHDEQLARLAGSVPEALGAAVIAGDPCFDRMVTSEPARARFRERLGADDDSTVVVVSSTWGVDSVLGRYPDLPAQLLAELPSDRYVVAAVVHPNTWAAHGPYQVRMWLGDCLRAGLRLVPPAEGWQQAVIAADVVIGDNGAVTGYAAALGRPVLLAAFPHHRVAAGSAIDELGRAAGRLDVRRAFGPQIEAAISGTGAGFAGVRALTTSVPGESAQHLRRIFYGLMDLPEPDRPPLLPQYPAAGLAPETARVGAWWVAVEPSGEHDVRVTRWPADVVAREEQPPTTTERHLVVATDHPRRDLIGNAAVVVDTEKRSPLDVLDQFPACVLAVCGDVVGWRGGSAVSVATADQDEDAVLLAASAVYAWLARGRPWPALPETLTVTAGPRTAAATLTAADLAR